MLKTIFNPSLDLCKDVSKNIKNNKINIDIKFKAFYTKFIIFENR